jgi:hypothetical protein
MMTTHHGSGTERPKVYVTGHNIMSKSSHTQQHYQKVNRNQKMLDGFVKFAKQEKHIDTVPDKSPPSHGNAVSDPVFITVCQESVEVEIPPAICKESMDVEIPPIICEESVDIEIPPAICEASKGDKIPPVPHEESVEREIPPAHEAPEGLWEDELDDCVCAGVEIRDWATLQDQVKKDMGKGARSLPVSQVNQLLII